MYRSGDILRFDQITLLLTYTNFKSFFVFKEQIAIFLGVQKNCMQVMFYVPNTGICIADISILKDTSLYTIQFDV